MYTINIKREERKETETTATNAKYSREHANERATTVNGETYTARDNCKHRGTFAMNEAGEAKAIKSNGYLSNDLATRKAIAASFNPKSFRKQRA